MNYKRLFFDFLRKHNALEAYKKILKHIEEKYLLLMFSLEIAYTAIILLVLFLGYALQKAIGTGENYKMNGMQYITNIEINALIVK